MGRDLADAFPVAAETFQEADDTLGFSLSRLMREGPAEKLTATENAQPALYAHAIAAMRAAGDRLGTVTAAAGHSLGELSAHAAAGTWSFADGLRAVRRRGELMARAGERSPGTMAALLGLDREAAEEMCREAKQKGMVLVPANLNAPGQIVVSGELAAVAWATEAAKRRGAKKVVPLNVSAAFHSPLMTTAAGAFAQSLAGTPMARPGFPVVSNVTAAPVRDPDEARDLLVRQLTAPVRWTECVARMVELGVVRLVELGPGQVLTRLNRRNARGLSAFAAGTPSELASLETAA